MNLTLYRIEPFGVAEGARVFYVLAPGVDRALEMAKHYIPVPRCITAVANNAWLGDDFPHFMGWDGRTSQEAWDALRKIAAIPNRESGPDWEEIEEARKIAADVLSTGGGK